MVEAGIESVKGTTAVFRKEGVISNRLEGSGAEWSVDTLEELRNKMQIPKRGEVKR